MARVFLSYDRDDAEKARRVALALERASHSVWWDLNIRGGKQFSTVIEEELANADVVVVLWSSASIKSAWVRDEAASGRDRECLVPVLIERVTPPLGFRQYQNIDITSRLGRGRLAGFSELLAAIAEFGPPTGHGQDQAKGDDPRHVTPKLAVAILLALVLLGGAYWYLQREPAEELHVVRIAPADPSAGSLARDLLAKLGSLPAVQAGALRLTSQSDDRAVDLVIETAGSATSGETASGLILKSGKDQGVIWSRHVSQPNQDSADLTQQMAFIAGRALRCALDALGAGPNAPDQQMLKIYVDGCVRSEEVSTAEAHSLVPIFRTVLTEAPKFEGAWAQLLLAESDAAIAPASTRKPDIESIRSRLREDIRNARNIAPELPELRIAEAAQLPRRRYSEALQILDRAKATSPTSAAVLRHRAAALLRVGRLSNAIDDSKLATEIAPWSPKAQSFYALTLAYSGRIAAGRAELSRAERFFPETPVLREARYDFHWHFGDPMLALQITPPGLPQGRELFLKARADPSSANLDRFIDFIHAMYARRRLVGPSAAILQEFAALGREDELYESILDPRNNYFAPLDEVLFRPPLKNFRRDRRFLQVAQREGLVDYWQKSGNWPDFCFEEEPPYDCKAEAEKLGQYNKGGAIAPPSPRIQ